MLTANKSHQLALTSAMKRFPLPSRNVSFHSVFLWACLSSSSIIIISVPVPHPALTSRLSAFVLHLFCFDPTLRSQFYCPILHPEGSAEDQRSHADTITTIWGLFFTPFSHLSPRGTNPDPLLHLPVTQHCTQGAGPVVGYSFKYYLKSIIMMILA